MRFPLKNFAESAISKDYYQLDRNTLDFYLYKTAE